MKKLIMMAALAGFMVACGSEKKAEEKTDAAATPETAVVEDVTAEKTTAAPEAITVDYSDIKANEKATIDVPLHKAKGSKESNEPKLIIADSKLETKDSTPANISLNVANDLDIKAEDITVLEVVK